MNKSESPQNPLFWGLLLFFVFEYNAPSSVFPPLGHFNALIPLGVFALSILVFPRSDYRFLGQRETLFLLLYLFLIGFGIVHADLTSAVYKTFRTVVGYIITYYIVSKEVRGFAKLKILAAFFPLIHGVITLLNLGMLTRGYRDDWIYFAGPFLGDGNDFALSCNIVWPLAAFCAVYFKRMSSRIAMVGLTVLLLVAIIGTVSRGGLLALGAIVAYYVVASRRILVGVVIVLLLIGLIFAFASDIFFTRMGTIAEYEEDGSAMGRIIAWKAAMRMALDHPFLGVGAGNFAAAFGTDYQPVTDNLAPFPWMNTHSMYFKVLGEMGFPGLVVFTGVMVVSMRSNRRLRLRCAAAGASDEVRNFPLFLNMCWVGFGVGGAFLTVAYYPHIFVLAGITVATRLAINQELQALSPDAAPAPAASGRPASPRGGDSRRIGGRPQGR